MVYSPISTYMGIIITPYFTDRTKLVNGKNDKDALFSEMVCRTQNYLYIYTCIPSRQCITYMQQKTVFIKNGDWSYSGFSINLMRTSCFARKT